MHVETVTVTVEDGYATTAKVRSHVWSADLPEESGGTDTAQTPEEGLLGMLGSCMSQTAKLYAARKGWQIDRIQVRLSVQRFKGADYEAYDGDAGFVHEIKEDITVEGPLDDDQRSRIIEIMGKCPVRRIVSNPVFFVDMEPVADS